MKINPLTDYYKSVFSVLFRGIINNSSVSTQSSYGLYQTHAWVSRVASHATALNIGIIIFIQCNHSSRFHTPLLNTQVVFRAQKKKKTPV